MKQPLMLTVWIDVCLFACLEEVQLSWSFTSLELAKSMQKRGCYSLCFVFFSKFVPILHIYPKF